MRRDEHRWIVDRFEGDVAVVEVDGERFLELPRWLLPSDAGEGDVIAVAVAADESGRRTVELRVDRDATERAREEAARLIEELRRRDPGGDVEL